MNNRRRKPRIVVNHALRNELINKGYVIPREMVSQWLLERGFEAAADAALERLKYRYNG